MNPGGWWRTALSFAAAPFLIAVVVLLCRLGVLGGKDNIECLAAAIIAIWAGPIVGGLVAVWALWSRERYPLLAVFSLVGQWGFILATYLGLF